MTVAQHADGDLRALGSFEPVHGLFVGDLLAHEALAVDHHDLVAGEHASLLGRSVLDDVLHSDGVLSDGELDAHAREAAFEVVGGSLHVLGGDVDRVGVELAEDDRDGLVDKRVDVDLVDVLVVDDAQEVVEPVAAVVDDGQPVAAEVVGVEGANDDADDDAERHEQGHEAVFVFFFHNVRGYMGLL